MILINMISLILNYLILILILHTDPVLSAEECKFEEGGGTFTITCSGSKTCCNDNRRCCSGLSTIAIVAFAVGGAVILTIIIVIVIYAIVKHKQKKNSPQVQPDNNTRNIRDPPPVYTPRAPANHPPPALPPSYEDINPSSSNAVPGQPQAGPLSHKVPL